MVNAFVVNRKVDKKGFVVLDKAVWRERGVLKAGYLVADLSTRELKTVSGDELVKEYVWRDTY